MESRVLPLLAAALLGLATAPLAQDVPAAGFGVTPLPAKPPILPGGPFGPIFGVARTLSNGDVLTFDGESVRRLQPDGTLVATLGTLAAPTFPGCIAVDPSDTVALVGAGDAAGDVYLVDLAAGGMSPLASLPFNFDAVFESPTSALVSANTSMSFSDNDILRIDLSTSTVVNVAFVSGPSGPIALDPAGNLYYGMQSPPSVIRWSAETLALGTLLSEADATALASGFLGVSSLAYDPLGGELYLAENDFTTFSGVNRIVRVGSDAATSPVLVEGGVPFNFLSGLEFVAGSGGAVFAPYQPAFGGTLRYSAVDFVATAERIAVEPLRPSAVLEGPGTLGPGSVDFAVSSGAPNGFALVFLGPTSAWSLPEVGYRLGAAAPLFTGFDLTAIDLTPLVVLLDADGAGALGAYHPGGLLGLLSVQALVHDAAAEPLGTTSVAHL